MNSASSLDLLRLSTINVIVYKSCGELLLQFCQSILLFRVSFFMFSWIKQLQNYKLFLFTLKMCSSNLKWSHFTNHTQTFSRLTFFQHFFSKYFRVFLGCSKTKKGHSKVGKDVLKQERIFINRIGHSQIDKNCVYCPFCYQTMCKIAIAHPTPKNEPHACTSRTFLRMDFARIRFLSTHPLLNCWLH